MIPFSNPKWPKSQRWSRCRRSQKWLCRRTLVNRNYKLKKSWNRMTLSARWSRRRHRRKLSGLRHRGEIIKAVGRRLQGSLEWPLTYDQLQVRRMWLRRCRKRRIKTWRESLRSLISTWNNLTDKKSKLYSRKRNSNSSKITSTNRGGRKKKKSKKKTSQYSKSCGKSQNSEKKLKQNGWLTWRRNTHARS